MTEWDKIVRDGQALADSWGVSFQDSSDRRQVQFTWPPEHTRAFQADVARFAIDHGSIDIQRVDGPITGIGVTFQPGPTPGEDARARREAEKEATFFERYGKTGPAFARDFLGSTKPTKPFATKDWMAEHQEKVFEVCRALRDAGQKEYAGGENAFGNFVRLAEELESTPEKVLWTYFAKHLDGIRAWMKGHRSQRESVHGRIRDAIVYLCLLDGMAEAGEIVTITDPAMVEHPVHGEDHRAAYRPGGPLDKEAGCGTFERVEPTEADKEFTRERDRVRKEHDAERARCTGVGHSAASVMERVVGERSDIDRRAMYYEARRGHRLADETDPIENAPRSEAAKDQDIGKAPRSVDPDES